MGFNGRHLRYCGDMIYSGHTYFVGLFSVGLYDLCRKLTKNIASHNRTVLRCIAGIVLSLVVLLDIVMILMNRFHYSCDVVLAVWLVFLLYTNGALAIVTEWWASHLWPPIEETKRQVCKMCKRKRVEDDDQGEIMIPPCFLPFCTIAGRYYVHHYPTAEGAPISLSEEYDLLGQERVEQVNL